MVPDLMEYDEEQIILFESTISFFSILIFLIYLDLPNIATLYFFLAAIMWMGDEDEDEPDLLVYGSWDDEEEEEYHGDEIFYIEEEFENNQGLFDLGDWLDIEMDMFDLLDLIDLRATPPYDYEAEKVDEIEENIILNKLVAQLSQRSRMETWKAKDIFALVGTVDTSDVQFDTSLFVKQREELEMGLKEVPRGFEGRPGREAYRIQTDFIRDTWIASGLYTNTEFDYWQFCSLVEVNTFGKGSRSLEELNELGIGYVNLDDDQAYRKELILTNYSKEELDQLINYKIYLLKGKRFSLNTNRYFVKKWWKKF